MMCVAGCYWLNAVPVASKHSTSTISCYLLVEHWRPVDSVGRQVDGWQWRGCRWHASNAHIIVQLNWTLLCNTCHWCRCGHCIITDCWRPALSRSLYTSSPSSQTFAYVCCHCQIGGDSNSQKFKKKIHTSH